MSDTIRAELFKLRKRPTAWVLLATAVVLSQIFGYLIPYLSYRTGDAQTVGGNVPRGDVLASTLPDQLVINSIGGFPVFAGALALVLGALMFGGEYGWGTVKTLLTQRPGRISVLSGQLVALGAALFVGVAVLFALSAASSLGIALAENQAADWPTVTDLAAGFGAGWLVLAMWASLGAVLGVTLRSVALPIGLGVVWVLGIENLVSAMAGSVLTALRPLRDVLPGVNAGSLVGAVIPDRVIDPPPGVTSSVAEPRALLTLLCYLVVCAAVAAWTSHRRDVV
ncbi:MAG: type transport system permease protein [Actinomycetota bacterium]|nr:type transport system permease protein [Actinomycetota bacterium]